jgi:hypothetical protein
MLGVNETICRQSNTPLKINFEDRKRIQGVAAPKIEASKVRNEKL